MKPSDFLTGNEGHPVGAESKRLWNKYKDKDFVAIYGKDKNEKGEGGIIIITDKNEIFCFVDLFNSIYITYQRDIIEDFLRLLLKKNSYIDEKKLERIKDILLIGDI